MTLLISLLMTMFQTGAQEVTVNKSKIRSILVKNYFQFHTGYSTWQERIPAVSAGNESRLEMQFQGLRVGASYHRPLNKLRWVQTFTGELQAGIAKGTGVDSTIIDQLENQSWFGFSFTPGMIYRTTAFSEVGVILPFTLRQTDWKLEAASQLKPDRESSFSVGIGAVYITRFSRRQSLAFSLVHQQSWDAAVWGLSWQRDFR